LKNLDKKPQPQGKCFSNKRVINSKDLKFSFQEYDFTEVEHPSKSNYVQLRQRSVEIEDVLSG